jgi:hypothetical protein
MLPPSSVQKGTARGTGSGMHGGSNGGGQWCPQEGVK